MGIVLGSTLPIFSGEAKEPPKKRQMMKNAP
jgi:hypothetical protein